MPPAAPVPVKDIIGYRGRTPRLGDYRETTGCRGNPQPQNIGIGIARADGSAPSRIEPI
jgi:hypothetical protein